MDKGLLLEHEGMYLAACAALFRREYRLTVRSNCLIKLYTWFSDLLKNCIFYDAHVFKAADFESPDEMYENLQVQNSPFCGLYLFLFGCLKNSFETTRDSYIIHKYKYAILFMSSPCIGFEEALRELVNAGCGSAYYMMFAAGEYKNLDFLNKALAGNSWNATAHVLHKQTNLKPKWNLVICLVKMGFHYTYLKPLAKQYSIIHNSELFFAGKAVNCIFDQISADSKHYNWMKKLHQVYVYQLSLVKDAIRACLICLLRKGINQDVRILISKTIWGIRSDEAWLSFLYR